MFRKMRRSRQMLPMEKSQEILYRGTSVRNAKVSFCVIDQDAIVPEEYTTYFRSVIVFGKIRILSEETEKRKAIEKLAVKYAPNDTEENRNQAIEREWTPLCVLELTPEHISGKEAIELVRQRG